MSDNETARADPVSHLDSEERRIVRLFREAFVLAEEQVRGAVDRYVADGGRLTAAFRACGLLTAEDEPVALAIEAGTEAVDLDAYVIAPHTAYLLDPDTAERCKALPISREGGVVLVAVCDPFDLDAIDEVKRHINQPCRTVVASEEALERALDAFCAKSEHPTIRAGRFEIATQVLEKPAPRGDPAVEESRMTLKLWERLTVLEGQVQILRGEVQALRKQLGNRE